MEHWGLGGRLVRPVGNLSNGETPAKLFERVALGELTVNITRMHRARDDDLLGDEVRRSEPATAHLERELVAHLEQVRVVDLAPELVDDHLGLVRVAVEAPLAVRLPDIVRVGIVVLERAVRLAGARRAVHPDALGHVLVLAQARLLDDLEIQHLLHTLRVLEHNAGVVVVQLLHRRARVDRLREIIDVRALALALHHLRLAKLLEVRALLASLVLLAVLDRRIVRLRLALLHVRGGAPEQRLRRRDRLGVLELDIALPVITPSLRAHLLLVHEVRHRARHHRRRILLERREAKIARAQRGRHQVVSLVLPDNLCVSVVCRVRAGGSDVTI